MHSDRVVGGVGAAFPASTAGPQASLSFRWGEAFLGCDARIDFCGRRGRQRTRKNFNCREAAYVRSTQSNPITSASLPI